MPCRAAARRLASRSASPMSTRCITPSSRSPSAARPSATASSAGLSSSGMPRAASAMATASDSALASIKHLPTALDAIRTDTEALGFTMASEPQTGSLLRTLAASKPSGRFLELGTGTGVGTAWLLAGMDASSRLDTVDNDAAVSAVAQRHLGHDPRVTFHLSDGAQFLNRMAQERFDFIYADTWPGKFTHLDLALSLLGPGGMYFVDDLLPQPSWPEEHGPKVPGLIDRLDSQPAFVATRLAWASGLMILVRTEIRSGI